MSTDIPFMLRADAPVASMTNLAKILVATVLAGDYIRLEHSKGVARRMGELYGGRDAALRDRAVAAGLLHDIGYGAPVTGHHAIDGALLVQQTALAELAPLVGWHSTAEWEAAARGTRIPVERPADEEMLAALWAADFTVTPYGMDCDHEWRIKEIRLRHVPSSPVARALDASAEAFEAALLTVAGMGR